jgi:hypothetical protein
MIKAGLVLAFLNIASAQTEIPDAASSASQLVSVVMRLPEGSHISFYEKAAQLLGDSVAIAVAKAVSPPDLDKVENARRIITVLGDAYSAPALIIAKEDRNPGVTLYLLNYLAEHSVDSLVRQQANELTVKIAALSSW